MRHLPDRLALFAKKRATPRCGLAITRRDARAEGALARPFSGRFAAGAAVTGIAPGRA